MVLTFFEFFDVLSSLTFSGMTINANKKVTPQAWSLDQNCRLLILFKLKYKIKGGINPRDISPDNIKQTITHYFPNHSYGSFVSLFRRKVREISVHKNVEGFRRTKGKHMFLLHLMYLLF